MEIIFQLHVRSYLTFPMYSRGPVLMPCFSPLSSVTELVGVEYRRTVGVVYQMFFSVGILILPLISYFITDWRWLQVVITAPYILFLSYYW